MTTNTQAVRRVLLITLALNVTVALAKIIIGLISGALAITADGVHSLVDGSGNVVGLVATRYSERPPDDDHPYGHGRHETLAALAIGVLLLVTAWEVVQGALERLGGGEPPQITPLVLVVMIGTLLVNIGVSRYQSRQGRHLGSQVLLADAANTRADVFVTLSVLGSMTLIVATGWAWLDIAAALVVTLLIGRAAWTVLSQSGRILVDTAPYDPAYLAEVVAAVPSVERVARARSRGLAGAAHIDVDVQVAPEMTAGHTAAVADTIRERLNAQLDGVSEVEVHFLPRPAESPDYALAARARADALGLATHEVTILDGPEGRTLDLHVEVPSGQTLDAAHAQVSQLESDLVAALPDIVGVTSHIEPAQTHRARQQAPNHHRLAARTINILNASYPELDWHDATVCAGQRGYALTLHVGMPPQLSVEAAHHIAEEAEHLLRARLPLERVTIHTEPHAAPSRSARD